MFALSLRLGLIRASRANTEAHDIVTHIVHPFLVKHVLACDVRRDNATDGVALTSGTVRVKFTTRVTSLDTNLREITKSHDLNVEICLDEMHGSERAVWNDACIITGLGAPGHRTFLLIRDRGIQVKRAKHAKVIQAVDCCHARH